MAIQPVDLGAPVTGVGGDDYRQAHTKINANFVEVDADIVALKAKDATQDTAINLKAVKTEVTTALGLKANVLDVNAKNATQDTAITAAQNKADAAIPKSEKGAVNGVATLGDDGKVTPTQLPDVTPVAWGNITGDIVDQTDLGTAATKEVGVDVGQIPLVEDIPDLAKTTLTYTATTTSMPNTVVDSTGTLKRSTQVLGTAATKDVGTVENKIPVFTEYGIAGSGIKGGAAPMTTGGSVNVQETLFIGLGSGVYRLSTDYGGDYFTNSPNLVMVGDGIVNVLAISDKGSGINIITSTPNGSSFHRRHIYRLYTDKNTNKGTNGVLSAKSPVTHLYHDRVEHTGDDLELQPIEFVKNGVGNYTLKNTTGLAQEGWYIVIPQDANGNQLVAVEYEDNNGDINIRTYKRKFDFEQAKIVADHDNPLDIPETRWIDLRFNDIKEDTDNGEL